MIRASINIIEHLTALEIKNKRYDHSCRKKQRLNWQNENISRERKREARSDQQTNDHSMLFIRIFLTVRNWKWWNRISDTDGQWHRVSHTWRPGASHMWPGYSLFTTIAPLPSSSWFCVCVSVCAPNMCGKKCRLESVNFFHALCLFRHWNNLVRYWHPHI